MINVILLHHNRFGRSMLKHQNISVMMIFIQDFFFLHVASLCPITTGSSISSSEPEPTGCTARTRRPPSATSCKPSAAATAAWRPTSRRTPSETGARTSECLLYCSQFKSQWLKWTRHRHFPVSSQ